MRHHYQYFDNMLDFVSSKLRVAHSEILEVGSGNGSLAYNLATVGNAATVVAIDPIYRIARNLPSEHAPNLIFHPYDLVQLKQHAGDSQFDIILFSKSYHHIDVLDMEAVIPIISHLLKPNGQLLICEPVAHGAFNHIIRPFHDESYVRAEAQNAISLITYLSPLSLTACIDLIIPAYFSNVHELETLIMRVDKMEKLKEKAERLFIRRSFKRLQRADGSVTFHRPYKAHLFNK